LSDGDMSQLRTARDRLCTICALATRSSQAADDSDEIETEASDSVAGGTFAFITGPAGTGKSRIIQAVTDLARRWECANIIRITATSGAAAALIRAQTCHSALGLSRRAVKQPPRTKIDEWSPVGILIVDEISMAGSQLLYRINTRLKQLKNKASATFGGVHVFAFGDFRQLPPVGDKPLYVNPLLPPAKTPARAAKQPSGTDLQMSVHGHELWAALRVGMELTVNERAKSDSEYSALLESFALNKPTPAQIATINSRVVTDSRLVVPHG
jgi:hypothetical protein